MHIPTALLKEHSRKQGEKIAAYIGNDQHKFSELVDCFLSNQIRLSQLAAFSLNIVVENNPSIINKHLPKILKNLEKPGIHDAVKRTTLKLLPIIEMPKKLHALIIQLSFSFLMDKKEAIAIRVFAMSVIYKLSQIYPELSNELLPIIEIEMGQNPKPAFVSRGKKILKSLQKHKGIKG
jgi:hypothetical protein